MKLEIKKVKQCNFDEIYELLKLAEFPYLPVDKQVAFNEFLKESNNLYIALDEGIIVLFLCFSENGEKLYFDIACSNKYRKKWACKKVLEFIFNTAFINLKYKEFYTNSFTESGVKAVEKLGFEKVKDSYYRLKFESDIVKKYLKIKEV